MKKDAVKKPRWASRDMIKDDDLLPALEKLEDDGFEVFTVTQNVGGYFTILARVKR